MARDRSSYRLADLGFLVAVCGVMAALGRLCWKVDVLNDKFAPAAYFILVASLMVIIAAWALSSAARTAPECVECGRRFFPPKQSDGRLICPHCRQRALSAGEMKQVRAKGGWVILASLAVVTSFIGYCLSDLVAARFARSYWLALPLLATGATLGLLAALSIAWIILYLYRNRMMAKDGYALAHAKRVAGEEGEESVLGPIRLWYSGPTDPAPMLLEQLEIVRGRFGAMVGGEIEVPGPLRIFCFAGRGALVAFHRQEVTDLWNQDGVYTPTPARRMTLATEIVRHRIGDTEELARSLFAQALLEQSEGRRLALWLRVGIARTLIAGGEGLDRLNRRMVVSMASGATLGEELFRFELRVYFKLLGNWPVHEDHTRLAQIAAQSWSLVEYLGGESATEDRRGRFRAYLEAIRRGEPDEGVFRDRFGHGYGRLLEDWRGWVSGRGIGSHGPPSPLVRAALLDRLIPAALDRRARRMDRILAVRGMGWEGSALGAGALIDLLQPGGEIPKEEIVWALESISGIAGGDDLEGWRAWWDDLPQNVRDGRVHRAGHAGGASSPSPTKDDP